MKHLKIILLIVVALACFGGCVNYFRQGIAEDGYKYREQITQNVSGLRKNRFWLETRYQHTYKMDFGTFKYIDSIKPIRLREFKVLRYQLRELNESGETK